MNTHTPQRLEGETQQQYAARRLQAKRIVEQMCHPDRGAGKQNSREILWASQNENRKKVRSLMGGE
jgi:hypothetical protein